MLFTSMGNPKLPSSTAAEAISRIETRFDRLKEAGTAGLVVQGFVESQISHELFLNMRYEGSDTSLMIASLGSTASFGDAFSARHAQEFGFTQPREILIDDVRVRSVGYVRNSSVGMYILSSDRALLKKIMLRLGSCIYRSARSDDQL